MSGMYYSYCPHGDCEYREPWGSCQAKTCTNPKYGGVMVSRENLVKSQDSRKITNADRIRGMSDEELAEFLGARSDCFLCQAYHKCHKEGMSCESALTEWLKSPADKDGEA